MTNRKEKETLLGKIDELFDQVNGDVQEQLIFYKEMFLTMIQNAPIGMFVREEGKFTYMNSLFSQYAGYEAEEINSGRVTLDQIIHPDDFLKYREKVSERLNPQEEKERYRLRVVKKDGSLLYTEIHQISFERNGKEVLVGSIIDVTEEVTTHQKLKENKERFESLFYHNPDAIFTIDLEGKFTDANPGCEVISGYSADEIQEMTFPSIIISEDLPLAIHNFERSIMGFTTTSDVTITKKDGSQRFLNVTSFPMKVDGEIVGAYGIAKDITDKVEYNKRMEELAFYDPLTNLPNRRLFSDRLQQVMEYSNHNQSQAAVLFLDLDRFKFINDSLGHQLGDEFLKSVSERLKDNLRNTDTISRFAGDEFAIVLPNIKKEETIKLAERLNQVLAEPFSIYGHSISTSASIGIAFSTGEEVNTDDLIKKADTAMYYSKRYGKNNYTIYSEELDHEANYKLTIEKGLKSAVTNNEFVLHYQPIIDLQTGEVIGMEALIRWNHPQFGLLSPDQFIPISEESGQIISIGKWVLSMACTQNKKWQEEGHPPFKIAVNISTIQLQQQNFVETVAKILEEVGLDSKWLELEVTESILMEDTEQLKENLAKLKKLGVSIAIDDFGTGYTSLSYLRQFSFDRVKIDRSFINDIVGDKNGKTITATIISLAQKLNMGVIAEGVEDDVQLSFLKKEKCDAGQGYYFSRPLPADLHRLPRSEITTV
ncbi:PAS domain S-box-containing protein/diguanylate cyclase (GGDEF) domain-containing protein [Mesobacillus persicus]|uniref:PAS domain S-box-containing protein/diguanylate cyclase (GGDEF) domain-containing protein n=1 Tax=Mesobacillus persicus TaxID=930146 RepID=A0A1H7Z1Y6_9BACI|nr:GGDEF domain-containing phosphodiesterase [Mesobacillus persicus]SEM52253.1 PAS domain S-box-containing protein/diguanylate cyclase (GGDEF) domain-containing protein [Mesobacillus persicus]